MSNRMNPRRQSKDGLSNSVIETVAGFTAGVAATLVVHPFDILKTRLQRESRRPTTSVYDTIPDVDLYK
jgi:hypothetical protein